MWPQVLGSEDRGTSILRNKGEREDQRKSSRKTTTESARVIGANTPIPVPTGPGSRVRLLGLGGKGKTGWSRSSGKRLVLGTANIPRFTSLSAKVSSSVSEPSERLNGNVVQRNYQVFLLSNPFSEKSKSAHSQLPS